MAAIKLAAASWQYVSPAENNLGQDRPCMNGICFAGQTRSVSHVRPGIRRKKSCKGCTYVRPDGTSSSVR